MSGNRIRVGVYMELGKAFMAHEIANYPAHQEHRATQLVARIRAAVRRPPTGIIPNFNEAIQQARTPPAIARGCMRDLEKQVTTIEALEVNGWCVAQTAKALGIGRSTLTTRLQRYHARGAVRRALSGEKHNWRRNDGYDTATD